MTKTPAERPTKSAAIRKAAKRKRLGANPPDSAMSALAAQLSEELGVQVKLSEVRSALRTDAAPGRPRHPTCPCCAEILRGATAAARHGKLLERERLIDAVLAAARGRDRRELDEALAALSDHEGKTAEPRDR